MGKYNFTSISDSACVSMGYMGSVEPMELRRRVLEPMDLEQIVMQMQENIMCPNM